MPDDLQQVSSLDTVYQKEQENYVQSKTYLGEGIAIAQDHIDLYSWLIDALQTPAVKLSVDSMMAMKFALSSQCSLMNGLIKLLQGHASDLLTCKRQGNCILDRKGCRC